MKAVLRPGWYQKRPVKLLLSLLWFRRGSTQTSGAGEAAEEQEGHVLRRRYGAPGPPVGFFVYPRGSASVSNLFVLTVLRH